MMAEELKLKNERINEFKEGIQTLESGIGEKNSRKGELAKAYEERKKEIE